MKFQLSAETPYPILVDLMFSSLPEDSSINMRTFDRGLHHYIITTITTIINHYHNDQRIDRQRQQWTNRTLENTLEREPRDSPERTKPNPGFITSDRPTPPNSLAPPRPNTSTATKLIEFSGWRVAGPLGGWAGADGGPPY